MRIAGRLTRVHAVAAIGLALAAGSTGSLSAVGDRSGPLLEEVARAIARAEMDLVAVRRDIHVHPELSGAEARTSALVAARLRARGLEVREAVGGYGVVGALRGGRPGPVVAFRADMDAVPSTARDPVDFPSRFPGVRHICGHDIHTTVGLALVEGFSAVRAELPGTILFLFQPSEETALGARAMLEASVFGESRPESIFAFHTAPLPVGQIGTKTGALLPGRDRVTISIQTTPGREDVSRRVVDAVKALNTLAPGGSSADPFIGVTSAQAVWDGARNEWRVISDLVVSDPVARAGAQDRMRALLAELERSGSVARMEWDRRIPGANNDPALELELRPIIERAVGSGRLVVSSRVSSTFSEDFGWFQEQTPGVMYWLGVANHDRGFSGAPHSPDFAADEDAIQIGARVMAAIILERLKPDSAPTSR